MAHPNDINTTAAFKKPNDKYLNYIPIVDKHVTFNYFFEKFLLHNQPCVIKNVAAHWKASKCWLNADKTDLNYQYLYRKYSNCDIMAYDCNIKHFNSHKTQKMSFQDYLLYWEAYRASNYSDKYALLYLKDWHLCNTMPNEHFYKVPKFFSSDWLNEYLVEQQKDDYRFVYMGPKGSWTPFHADVFKSYSWSVNIFGKKRWIMLVPGEEKHLMDRFGNMPHEIVDVPSEIKHFEIIQEAGDAIFVPTGWYHQVTNVEDAISINHNWINGCNVMKMYLDMKKHLEDVQEEISDCKEDPEFEEQCQVVLNASYGMNYHEFLQFVEYIARKRMQVKQPISSLHKFDLLQIKAVLETILPCGHFGKLNLEDNTRQLYDDINGYLY